MNNRRKMNSKRKHSDSRLLLPKSSIKYIETLFEKRFEYECSQVQLIEAGCKLSCDWSCQDYLNMKDELNNLKNELNDKDNITWHKHTRACNPACKIAPEIRSRYKPELCTQAWCKFYEIANTFLHFDPNQPLFSVHLCEAPGAFITSLNQYLYSTGEGLSKTLYF